MHPAGRVEVPSGSPDRDQCTVTSYRTQVGTYMDVWVVLSVLSQPSQNRHVVPKDTLSASE